MSETIPETRVAQMTKEYDPDAANRDALIQEKDDPIPGDQMPVTMEVPPAIPIDYGYQRLDTRTVTLRALGAGALEPFSILPRDPARRELQIAVTSVTAADGAYFADNVAKLNGDYFMAWWVPAGQTRTLRDYSGPLYVSLPSGTTGPVSVAIAGVTK